MQGRGNGGQGERERGRSDCWWQGSRSLGDRRTRWKEACYGGTDVMERSCAVARRIDINKYPLGPGVRGTVRSTVHKSNKYSTVRSVPPAVII